jgi:hypothetical protein
MTGSHVQAMRYFHCQKRPSCNLYLALSVWPTFGTHYYRLTNRLPNEHRPITGETGRDGIHTGAHRVLPDQSSAEVSQLIWSIEISFIPDFFVLHLNLIWFYKRLLRKQYEMSRYMPSPRDLRNNFLIPDSQNLTQIIHFFRTPPGEHMPDRPHWVLSSDHLFLGVVKSPHPEHWIAAPSRMAKMLDPRL